jgi:hypothetical protein
MHLKGGPGGGYGEYMGDLAASQAVMLFPVIRKKFSTVPALILQYL